MRKRFQYAVAACLFGMIEVGNAALPVIDNASLAQLVSQVSYMSTEINQTLGIMNSTGGMFSSMVTQALSPYMSTINQISDAYGQFDSAYNSLSNEVNTVRSLVDSMSSLQGILGQLGINASGGNKGMINSPAFANVQNVKNQPCYNSVTPGACNQLYSQSIDADLAAKKASADTLLNGIQQAQTSIDNDMNQLRLMHSSLKSHSTTGTQQALVDAAAMGNQISLKLNDQLAQMRALQTAQMAMAAMAQESATAEAARAKAASDKLFKFTPDDQVITTPATEY
jgi:conjugal transfer/entry exclusion protein